MKTKGSNSVKPIGRLPSRWPWRAAWLTALGFVFRAVSVDADPPRIIGWTEPVELAGGALTLSAKIDTGADSSSVDARDVRIFARDGKRWVSFVVVDDDTGKKAAFERPLLRMVRVRRASSGWQRRPAVMLDVCLADVRRTTPVNLIDREHMREPMLIGRAFLNGDFAVLSSRTNTTAPRCAPATGR